jgi:maleate isomerase
LLEEGEEARSCSALQDKFGYPIITAAAAVRMALHYLEAKRIALACPYPSWLLEHAVSFWRQQDFDIVASFSAQPQMDDTRAIYKLDGAQASQQMSAALQGVDCDVMVITGTGLPSLQAICDLQNQFGVPVINSNLALAWACLRVAKVPLDNRAPELGFPLLGGWQEQVKRL